MGCTGAEVLPQGTGVLGYSWMGCSGGEVLTPQTERDFQSPSAIPVGGMA